MFTFDRGSPEKPMTSDVERFRKLCREIHDLQAIRQVLEWDQSVMMPKEGAVQRGQQHATLTTVIQDRLRSNELGDLIESLKDHTDTSGTLAADLREIRHSRDRALKVPVKLSNERARVCSMAQSAWEEALKADDFQGFRPHLEEVIRLTREIALAMDEAEPYDALLDGFERGMTQVDLAQLFSRLRSRTTALLDRILGADHAPDRSVLRRSFPLDVQEVFNRGLARDMGYRVEAGRIDRSVHPFTIGTFRDVRFTTRLDQENLGTGLFSSMHETGHAIYEQGLDAHRFRDPSGHACSLGIHESQSRFWENLVGRSRPFWSHYFPSLKEAFSGTLDDLTADDFYGSVNVCEPSLIRVEADEVTYNLHIILRFELESDLIAGRLEASDLPGAWKSKMQSYLGVMPPDEQSGVLQDVHWPSGMFGYFPTYALGNLYAAQFMAKLREEIPDMDERVAGGELAFIKEWLNTNIHAKGRLYLPTELCEQVTGSSLSIESWMDYLEQKYSAIYDL